MSKESGANRDPKGKAQGPKAGVWFFIAMLSVITLIGYGIAAATGDVCANIAASNMNGLMQALTKPAFLCR